MNEIMYEILTAEGMPIEEAEEMFLNFEEEIPMYVITNDKGVNGATSILYKDELQKLSDKTNSDLYILPSSIHEVIAIPASMGEPNELAKMVKEVNFNEVQLDERLSNQVYHYNKKTKELTLATDTPDKKLDNKQKEENKISNAEKLKRMGKGR